MGRIAVQRFPQCVLVAGGRSADLCVMAPTCGRLPVLEHDCTVFSCDHFVDLAHRLGHVDGDLGAVADDHYVESLVAHRPSATWLTRAAAAQPNGRYRKPTG